MNFTEAERQENQDREFTDRTPLSDQEFLGRRLVKRYKVLRANNDDDGIRITSDEAPVLHAMLWANKPFSADMASIGELRFFGRTVIIDDSIALA